MLTVDFDRLGLRPGDRVLDMGCGAGRHAFEMYRRGADVIAFDQDADELSAVSDLFAAMRDAGEVPLGAEADVKEGDALSLPFADGEFDRVVASEVLEHIPADTDAIAELVRVLRPGGTIAVTVPRWLPEKICWALSDAYHEVEGGHVRIYTGDELVAKLQAAGLSYDGKHHAHGLHSPYWWIKCAVGVTNDEHPLVKGYHQVLVWDIMRKPRCERADPRGRAGAQPADRQEHGAVPAQARGGLLRCAARLPSVRGVLTAAEVAETAASIVAMQEPDGAVPWTVGAHVDVWNHVEAAMALLAAGEVEAAERGLRVVPAHPARRRLVADEGRGGRGRGRQRRDQHERLPRGRGLAPLADPSRPRRSSSGSGPSYDARWTSSRACSCRSAGSPGPRSGTTAHRQRSTARRCVAGSSSIYQSLRAGVALAELVGEPQPEWELAGGRLGHALREHRDLFLDKSHVLDGLVLPGPRRRRPR